MGEEPDSALFVWNFDQIYRVLRVTPTTMSYIITFLLGTIIGAIVLIGVLRINPWLLEKLLGAYNIAKVLAEKAGQSLKDKMEK